MNLDRIGMGVSLICALHCLLVPLLFALVPALALALHSFQSPHRPLAMWLWRLQSYDTVLAGVAISWALFSLVLGWRRHHQWRPLLWWLLSLPLFGYGLSTAVGGWLAHALALASAGVCLVVAHVSNLRRLQALRPSGA